MSKTIKQVSHQAAGLGPACTALALEVAYELHAPRPPARATEVATPELMGLRIPATRPHRHKVPLKRLTAVHS
ncbi:hypothetical protein [Streptomyces shenzhenensis]|uniref:Uncharacterized protein n=1 Tax=Streptomyces shenzhenensis TaxID=943815 RepID=A0A3M0HYC1_9ACTN|nr:hypothetical protein [Streptomyces shenzhenensis]RMB81625.1 hypothetical protein CTZ28_33980 [Streptomyces shenzhenensis]